MQIIVTIKTNGVDFALVAGAICGVYFSNGVTNTSGTLNINSTGAKTLEIYNIKGGSDNQTESGKNNQRVSHKNTILLYNGSSYGSIIKHYLYGTYSDST